MNKQHKTSRHDSIICSLQHVTFTTFIVIAYVVSQHLRPAQAGASSTPKNLVDNFHISSDTNNLTTASSNQFQNEYQYRQTASKSISSFTDRHKLSTSSMTDPSLDHATHDSNYPSVTDYSYYDSRAMTNVPDCRGRLKLSGSRGFITDGPGYYQTNLQCIWLIDSGNINSTIRIRLHQFNTECNYDFLYVFDGDSVYSPLVAALSGDMKDFSNVFLESNIEDLISVNCSDIHQASVNNSIHLTSPTSPIALLKNTIAESHPIEVKTNSGKAFIYFHSDTAQSMPGFYITYSVDSCPLDCSNRGECDYKSFSCKCNAGYYGDGCQFVLCPNNCTSPIHGICDIQRSCVCNRDYTGSDCSKETGLQIWKTLVDTVKTNPSRAFHQSVLVDNILWVFGGKSKAFSNTNMGIFRHNKTPTILAFDLNGKRWLDLDFIGTTGEDHLAELSGHSAVAYGNKVFIYGGLSMNNTILSTLTVFDIETRQLSSISSGKISKGSEEEFVAPLSVTGHSANIIDGHMYVFMGYNALFGYLNFVQKLNIANNSWSIIERRGSSVGGCIGHTSTFDPESRLVFIYGGHNSLRSNKLYSFDPQTEVWTYLLAGPSPRYYHSAVITNGLLMILGGNSYNTSHQSDQCFQQSHLMFDLGCAQLKITGNKSSMITIGCGQKCWSSVEDTTTGLFKRHGHSVLARNDTEMILYGGFNGVLMNDLRFLDIPKCSDIMTEANCIKTKFALNCEWNIINAACQPKTSTNNALTVDCSKSSLKLLQTACDSRETCSDCLNTNLGCVWCGIISQCQYKSCKSANHRALISDDQCDKEDILTEVPSMRNITNLTDLGPSSKVDPRSEIDCKLDNCYLCQSRPHCSWQNDGCSYSPPNTISSVVSSPLTPQEELNGDTQIMPGSSLTKNSSRTLHLFDPFDRTFIASLTNTLSTSSPYQTCDIPCFMRRSCNECTTTKCIWCSTTEQCIDSSAYFTYHAMGQCMHYVAHMSKCPAATCSDIETCDKCLANPKCGWLNDISNTGKGRCLEGNSSEPSLGPWFPESIEPTTIGNTSSLIKIPNWYYTSCPQCQCNGHSYCRQNSSICMLPCQDYTEGHRCERCIPGYFGDPVNGGLCRPCHCNGHAQSCDKETGKCYCSTKGIIGHNCHKCDDKNYYIGDPTSPGNGTCYYNLTTDYQYTFNMSKPDDHFYSDINFINVPLRKDSDVDFSIACSRLALVNITSGTSYKTRRLIHAGVECGSFRLRFTSDRYALGEVSFFVHVYKFQTPFILQIAFSQHRTLYLPQFFFTFSSFFLFFFALFGLAWKLKQEYDNYVRRQRQFIEMEQMASRPYSTILLEMFRWPSAQKSAHTQNQKQQAEPTPISFEPCFGGNVGVMSVFVQLPGKPNLAIASAFVSLNDQTSRDSHEDSNDICKHPSSKGTEND